MVSFQLYSWLVSHGSEKANKCSLYLSFSTKLAGNLYTLPWINWLSCYPWYISFLQANISLLLKTAYWCVHVCARIWTYILMYTKTWQLVLMVSEKASKRGTIGQWVVGDSLFTVYTILFLLNFILLIVLVIRLNKSLIKCHKWNVVYNFIMYIITIN